MSRKNRAARRKAARTAKRQRRGFAAHSRPKGVPEGAAEELARVVGPLLRRLTLGTLLDHAISGSLHCADNPPSPDCGCLPCQARWGPDGRPNLSVVDGGKGP